MYSVQFEDLKKVITAFEENLPCIKFFTSIEGNAHGDFIIKTGKKTFYVRHTDLTIWKMSGNWKDCEWTPI